MQGGSKFLATAAILAVAGCGGERPQLQIRPTATPLSATAKPVPFRIAEAYSHLALGNVALAIESFRKALREQPDSVEAMAGLAACYDQMARFDLSRRYYEAALAVTPADTGLLNAFARSLDRQGHLEEAANVRREISVRLAAATPQPAPAAKPQPAPAIPIAAQRQLAAKVPAPVAGPSVTIALPPPRPAPIAVAAAEHPIKPQPKAAAPAADPPVTVAPPVPKPIAVAAAQRPVKARPVAPAAAVPPLPVAIRPVQPIAVVTAELTVMAQPAAPAPAAPAAAPESPPVAARAPVAPPPAPAPVIVSREIMAQRMPTLNAAPRLERMSSGEVALITTGRPQWRSKIVTRTAQSTTVRFVPLRSAAARPVRIRLLNAARHQGLAARTRKLLAVRGWRQLAIGDARRVRQTSLILYPANRRATAVRLGAQFGIPIAKRASGGEFVMLLGRDAAKLRAVRG